MNIRVLLPPPTALVALMVATALPFTADAQNKAVTATETIGNIEQKTLFGTVRDSEGEPLAGATVMLEGTQQGVATDVDGNFTILTKKKDPVLVISYVGMKTVRLECPKGTKLIDVKLDQADNMMNEIVVTGYQNIKRESATGSYQILSAEDLDKRSVTDLSANLEGKIPGLVKNMKSESNDEDAFTIRGAGSFTANTAPLVVVDGLPIEGGMSTVNPYDVESITVLKDAAAASIYGARASNGVIVITTKTAKQEKLTIDFNADLTISDRIDYSKYEWASAAQVLQLEKNNFNAMVNDPAQTGLGYLASNYERGFMHGTSPATHLLYQNYLGMVSDDVLNSTFDSWSKNDYRKEWADVHDRNQVTQQYNVSLRNQGKRIGSTFTVNYSADNMGVRKEYSNSLTFKYRGDIKVAKWMDLSVGINVLNTRRRTHDLSSMDYAGINSFMPYQSMYNADGSLARMEAEVYPYYDAFDNPDYELKDVSYNFTDEMNRNFNNYRYTNTRTYIHSLFRLLPGWTAQAQFQYEDISSRSQTIRESDSYIMRRNYDVYTTGGNVVKWIVDPDADVMDWFMDPDNFDYDFNTGEILHRTEEFLPTEHHLPDGAYVNTLENRDQYYTFRAQTNYKRDFGKHSIDLLAGMEYRQTHSTSDRNILLGYNPTTLENKNMMTDWQFIHTPSTSVLGEEVVILDMNDYSPYTSDILHRFYSVYFTGNYVFDSRYSLSGSYRVDKTDLFGADPKFRGRPLWSAGASWNIHNESFMRGLTIIDALKLRGSYGLTGNIYSGASSYLTAYIYSQPNFAGNYPGLLSSPPNDQLRWEKTATWNIGLDFALFGYRLNGSVDYYHKSGSDLITRKDLDKTTGWTNLPYINCGNMVNNGIEIQLDARLLQTKRRRDLGINLGVNFSLNKNKVTSVSHYASSGYDYLGIALKEGYPMNSIFSFDYAGIVEEDGLHKLAWRDHNGDTHTTPVGSPTEFTIEDAVYCGSTTPKFSGSFTPEITWNGFSLSGMFNYYGGHYMRVYNDWYTGGGYTGYTVSFGSGAEIPAAALNYWNGDTSVPASGSIYSSDYDYNTMRYALYRNNNVKHADYLKLRTLVLSYNFDRRLCRKIKLNDLRLRLQMNNVCTWARNSMGYDPETLMSGYPAPSTPRSYTMSVFFNL